MNKAAKIRNVFQELRSVIGAKATSFEVLQCANALVEMFSDDEAGSGKFDLRIGGLPFENWSLDAAFADGGWRILKHEMDAGIDFNEEEWGSECPHAPQEVLIMEEIS